MFLTTAGCTTSEETQTGYGISGAPTANLAFFLP